ncbi:hypothetical protein CRG98_000302 [Punica granatum]|uniref:Uncharacterized protein n=1 Tax=Punica granatum TaxID=22663 RepID=A0A2I0LF23_PUNGR|nr:hypothetical protein CRG98_000302 [Punica granatum]
MVYGPECGLSSGPACALLDRAACECPPFRGWVTDTGETESPLIVLRSEGRDPISYSGLRERVGEGFESRVTRWNTWLDVRVQRGASSGELGTRGGRAWAGTGATWSSNALSGAQAGAGGCAWVLVSSVCGRRTCGSVDVHVSTRRDVRGAQVQAHERACGDTERLALELMTGVLFTREHNVHPK